MNRLLIGLLLALCGTTGNAIAQQVLRQQLEKMIQPYQATVGIAIMQLESGDTLTVNNRHHYPMQSVYKFPLAMAVLHQADQGKISLDRKVFIRKQDLRRTWSPLRDQYPNGNMSVTVAQLLEYTVSQSDNNTCDVLFRLLNGPATVAQYVRSLAIPDMVISTTEKEMSAAWKVQYTNWTTPFAMVRLLAAFYRQQSLSATSNNYLMQLMINSANSPKRLKGLLPEATIVAHKTGTSDTNSTGMRAATNDVGIITLANGQHIAIAVFVSDTKEPADINEAIIARISKAAVDYFAANK